MFEKLLLAGAMTAPKFDALSPTGYELPALCSVEGGGAPAGGAPGGTPPAGTPPGDPPKDTPPPRTFSQDDVNGMLAKERREAAAKFSDYDDLKSKVGEIEKLRGELAKQAEEKTLEGASEIEKLTHAHQKDLRKFEKQIEDATAANTAAAEKEALAVSRWKTDKINAALTSALASKDALPRAVAQAAELLAKHGKAQVIEDEGQPARVVLEIDGVEMDATGAAEAWLRTNDHFAKAPGGGAGSRSGDGGLPADMHTMPSKMLFEAALRSPPK